MVGMSGTMTEYANKLFTQPRTALSTSSQIVKNQYGKYVRKYKWDNKNVDHHNAKFAARYDNVWQIQEE